ncbi:MAG TPA: hypothetical protein VGN18_04885 [Jatrophihabitans sp.]|jgi:hypothetical protein|uniref:hypothetical protein n=1 Tax=Jatrophihabitans sp. TaxID=1932789 RepID=UPI002DFBA0C0|nr:hypothetical protein [Jatrophihabitans sp.]
MSADLNPISAAELEAESGTALPDKEVMSLLDLNANLDLALDVAAPIDLAVGANANVAAPINASVGANVLSLDSSAGAEALQASEVHQGVVGDATATSHQLSGIDQGTQPVDGSTTPAGSPAPAGGSTAPAVSTPDPSSPGALDGNLLNVNVNLNGDLHMAAPIDGAVAANANVAAPIDASVSANVGSVGSDATAIAHQSSIIDQSIDGNASATADQSSNIKQ